MQMRYETSVVFSLGSAFALSFALDHLWERHKMTNKAVNENHFQHVLTFLHFVYPQLTWCRVPGVTVNGYHAAESIFRAP
jgi:hypothetical protein